MKTRNIKYICAILLLTLCTCIFFACDKNGGNKEQTDECCNGIYLSEWCSAVEAAGYIAFNPYEYEYSFGNWPTVGEENEKDYLISSAPIPADLISKDAVLQCSYISSANPDIFPNINTVFVNAVFDNPTVKAQFSAEDLTTFKTVDADTRFIGWTAQSIYLDYPAYKDKNSADEYWEKYRKDVYTGEVCRSLDGGGQYSSVLTEYVRGKYDVAVYSTHNGSSFRYDVVLADTSSQSPVLYDLTFLFVVHVPEGFRTAFISDIESCCALLGETTATGCTTPDGTFAYIKAMHPGEIAFLSEIVNKFIDGDKIPTAGQ